MKRKVILVSLIVLATLMVGCAQTPATTDSETNKDTETSTEVETSTDVVTTASLVDTTAAFESAISKDGTWIIATLKDLTFTKDLVLEGTFVNGKKDDAGADVTQRKIAPYTQDEAYNVTARYTITAPKLTIMSPKASFEHGTFVGDMYVSVADFQLKDAKVDGNIYFTTPEAQSTFLMDATSSVTGVQELK
ncbi:MAG: hypothetical protein ACOH15_09060 [Acetobacterium sp.]